MLSLVELQRMNTFMLIQAKIHFSKIHLKMNIHIHMELFLTNQGKTLVYILFRTKAGVFARRAMVAQDREGFCYQVYD